jgi:hypothetical protein
VRLAVHIDLEQAMAAVIASMRQRVIFRLLPPRSSHSFANSGVMVIDLGIQVRLAGERGRLLGGGVSWCVCAPLERCRFGALSP